MTKHETGCTEVGPAETCDYCGLSGYDYANQAWVRSGRYERCGHPESMICGCYGKLHEGEPVASNAEVE